MRRSPEALADKEFDVLIVGAGAFGAAAAWDAALRGLRVAVIERADFGSGVSANSFKVVHGGIRYLQHADIVRLRASCRERSALLRIAPHLVQPLPIVIPTYGYGRSGKALLATGMALYDLLTFGRNRGIPDPRRRIPRTRLMGRDRVLDHFPDVAPEGLTGGGVFCDAQMYNPPRLVLAFIRSAAETGAVVCNYVKAQRFLRDGDRVTGVRARDLVTGTEFQVRARVVLNTAGPWSEYLARELTPHAPIRRQPYSRDACFVITRRFPGPFGLAVQGRTKDPDALLSRPSRHLFIVPWREFSLVGVWHRVLNTEPDATTLGPDELSGFIDEINWAYPGLELSIDDVRMTNFGLVPFGENAPAATDLSYGKRSPLVDHAERDGIEGVVTLIGVRYTMARGDSAVAVDLVQRKLGQMPRRAPTESTPLVGGHFENFEALVAAVQRAMPILSSEVAQALVHNHGSRFDKVIDLVKSDPASGRCLGYSTVLRAEVVHAIRDEMAVELADIVFRRSDLGTGGRPGGQALNECAQTAAQVWGWSPKRTEDELVKIERQFPSFDRDKSGLTTSGRAVSAGTPQ